MKFRVLEGAKSIWKENIELFSQKQINKHVSTEASGSAKLSLINIEKLLQR